MNTTETKMTQETKVVLDTTLDFYSTTKLDPTTLPYDADSIKTFIYNHIPIGSNHPENMLFKVVMEKPFHYKRIDWNAISLVLKKNQEKEKEKEEDDGNETLPPEIKQMVQDFMKV